MPRHYPPPPETAVVALSNFYRSMLPGTMTAEEENRALTTLINTYLPLGSFTMAWLKGPARADIKIEPPSWIIKASGGKEDGIRHVDPRAIPLIIALMLYGGRLYLDSITSKIRRDLGARKLHYLYLFSKPHHLTLHRVIANAGPEQKVELVGQDHRELYRRTLYLAPDSKRTQTAAREDALKEALRLHAINADVKVLAALAYAELVRFFFKHLDDGNPLAAH